jgi:hypothetical protein
MFDLLLPTEPMQAVAGTVAIIAGSIMAASALAGGAMQAIAAKQQGEAADEAAKYNAAVAQNDAVAAQNAAAYEARQIRRKNMLRLGMQRSEAAKSGVSLDAGSSFDDVMFDTAIQGELEAQAALYSGALRAQAQRSSASMALLEGKRAKRAAGMGVASGAIGALGGVAQGGFMIAQGVQMNNNSGGGPVFNKGKSGFPEM